MRNSANIIAVCMLCLTAGGCSWTVQSDARRLIETSNGPGKMMLKTAGTSEELQAKSRITSFGQCKAPDGAMIDYWVIRHSPPDASRSAAESPGRGTVLVLHPLMTSKAWFLTLGETLGARGYDVVLPDLRAHGDSGGQYVTWGAMEKRDLTALMDKLLEDKLVHKPIYVAGASLGGCVAIQYAAFDKRCQGVLAIAPPMGIREVARLMFPFHSQADINARLKAAGEIGSFDPADASAVEAAAALKCPLILVHGYWDFVVPYSQSEAILAAAGGPKKLVPLAWAGHATAQMGRDSWLADRIDELATMKPSPATSRPASRPRK